MAIGAATDQTADRIVSANNGHNMAADEARTARPVQRDEAVTRATSAEKSGGARSNLVKYAYDHLFHPALPSTCFIPTQNYAFSTHTDKRRCSGLGAFGVSFADLIPLCISIIVTGTIWGDGDDVHVA